MLYGSETLVWVKKCLSKIQALKIRFLRSGKGCAWRDRFYNEDICIKSWKFLVPKSHCGKQERWIAHLNKMPDSRFPKEVWKYKSIGKRSTGILRKRLWSGCYSFGSRTGLFPDGGRRRRRSETKQKERRKLRNHMAH